MGNDVTQNARWMAPYGCLDAALHYLNKGYSVIATEPQGKRPLGPWTTFQKRLPTKAEVRAMWQKQPDANVAIVTGAISGIFALDTDGAAADNQIHKLGGIPTTPTSRTAKGRHYIFQHPGFHVSNRVHLYEGVDIRGDGGYIVVPPSIHPTGIQYTWDISLEDATPAKPPSWLLETLSYHEEPQPATDSKPPDWVMQALQGVAEGERDDTCHRLACHYLAKGICPEEVALLLLRWNERNHPPMGKLKGDLSPEEFVKQKIESARSFLEESSYAVELQQKLKSIASLNLASERELKLKELSTEMDIPIKALRKDLATVSASTKYTVGEAPEESFTHEELMKGRDLLANSDILDCLVSIVDSAGHVGEALNKKMLILAGISTRLDRDTINLYIKSASGAGKSFLVKKVLAIMPPSWVYALSRITANALFYLRGQDLSHKILFVDEAPGVSDTDYGLRIGISEGELSVLVTTKNQRTGQLGAEEIRVAARGMVFISTTTKLSLHPEMETRVLDLFIDETQDQTARILEAQAYDIDDLQVKCQHRCAQAALAQIQALQVTVPFAPFLARAFPTTKVRARRDFPKFLSLVRASALLHQLQRERQDGKVVASMRDYAIAKQIAMNVLAQTLKGISPQEEVALNVIRDVFHDCQFSVRELWNSLREVSYQRAKNIVGQLKDKGIISWNGEKGWKSKYEFVEDPRDELQLPTPEELKEMVGTYHNDYRVTKSPAEGELDTKDLRSIGMLPTVTESVTVGNISIGPRFADKGSDSRGRLVTWERKDVRPSAKVNRDPLECNCYRAGILRCGVPCAWAWPADAKAGDLANWARGLAKNAIKERESQNA